MRTPEFYKGKEQTYVKHFFLENYLQTVAFHIGLRSRSLFMLMVSQDLGVPRMKLLPTRHFSSLFNN
jgi:hypothetical protein